jgi:dipeptidyl aminopeptidase/acylaminoacyl peptidase
MTLSACTPITSLSSFAELKRVTFILKVEPLENDLEYLAAYELGTKELREKFMEYIEFKDHSLDLIPADNIIGYKIRYKSDDEEVVGFVSAPADYQNKNYPVLLYNRGGGPGLTLNEPSHIRFLAQFGFIVLASQYRGADGGTGKDEFGGADVNDVVKLIDLAEMLSFASGKIYMLGWSRGAMQTYITLSKDDRIDAAVCGAGLPIWP